MTWRDILKVHPAADAFPLMSEAELRALGEDIRATKLRTPIVLWGPAPAVLLDGRNRLDAMELVGLPTHDSAGLLVPMRHEPSTVDPVDLVISLNLHRRHLDASQRAMVAATIATMRQGERTDLPSRDGNSLSQADAGRLLNVSTKSVERAATVRREGSPELVEAVERGEVPVRVAAEVAKSLPAEQKRIVELPPAARREAVRQALATAKKTSSAAKDASGPSPSLQRDQAVTAFAALLHGSRGEILCRHLDDLQRMLNDEAGRIGEIPLAKRAAVARGFLKAMTMAVEDLQPIETLREA
jgi:hypothetical protein